VREYKFRAWDNGKMQNVSFNNLHVNFHHPKGTIYIRDEMKPFGNTHETTLMQYTGLKDKNGKEIYEGDILKTDLSRPYVVVVFRNGAFMYQCQDEGNDYFDHIFHVNAPEKEKDQYLEVVGNIYENPELIN
jgi:uncharacterized phage protein (TIGR01671 family)